MRTRSGKPDADGIDRAVDVNELSRYMMGQRFGVISTIAQGGDSQSALIGVAVAPDLTVVFDTLKTSRKYANLVRRPQCSLVIGWDGEQTLQFEGEATEPEGDALRAHQQIYFKVWPDGTARLSWPDIAYFVVRPRWIRYSDYAVNPPLIVEFVLSGKPND